MIFLVYCIVSLFCDVFFCPLALRDIFHNFLWHDIACLCWKCC